MTCFACPEIQMKPTPAPDLSILRHFADLQDPRIDRTKKHMLSDVLVIALCATLAGADSFDEIERFGHAKCDWRAGLLELPNGIPSHDTFNRVFALEARAAGLAGEAGFT